MVIYKLIEFGVAKEKILVLCDASLRYSIDNLKDYNTLIRLGFIKETPAGVQADEFILSYCIEHDNSLIISNDLFRDFYSQFPSKNWILKKRITVMKIKKEILIIPMLKN